ncbi:MAG: ABC transporter ATP-binding protein [Planctomycetota bacterium]|jgi:ABC-2 type transport system ATP-binding protein|nr:ABC transporter ATP-binding protein [Planctomycetota bacterium]
MNTKVLELEGLVVKYGSFTALHGVDASFSGGALGLLGPNGAGKSSMLRSILGLVAPAAGSVRVFGEDTKAAGARLRRKIGYMPERDCFLGGVSCVSGLSHFAQTCGFPKDDAMLRAHDVLHFVGLGEERYREVSTFSVGMRQRYKLAAALVHDPDVMFLDEPTNGLDPQSRMRMLGLVERVSGEHGIHLILASHLLPDVERLCNEVWVLDQGKMKRTASMEELTTAARGAKRIRIDREGAAAFTRCAQEEGLTIDLGRNEGELVVTHPEVIVEPENVFALARKAGVPLLGVKDAARSLEDAFLEALEGETETDGETEMQETF